MAVPAPNRRQLTEDLANHEAQLDQVEAALTNDPDNEELLKLKNDLLDVKKLTLDLLELAPAPKPSSAANLTATHQWNIGDRIKAVWPENGRYYSALIEVVSADGLTASVRFDSYGTTIFVNMHDLRPLSFKDEPVEKQSSKKFVKPNAKEKKAEIREYKKKKAAKKKERMNEIEEFREKEKSRWKAFSTKSSKARTGPLGGKQRKSIFAVPDSLEGKVGVGTCNVGGKGMTDFSSRTKNSSLRHDLP